MNQQDERALKVLGVGAVLGALFGGVRGAFAGLVVGGAVAAEGIERGGGWKFLEMCFVRPSPVAVDETVYDAIPVFDDEVAPVGRRLLLTDGLKRNG